MAIQNPISDLDRSIQHDQTQDWPESVTLQLVWRDKDDKPLIRSEIISADSFFGRGDHGAPLNGDYLISAIERMRRLGAPKPMKKLKK